MTLDPQCQALIDMLNDAGSSPFDATDANVAREAYRNTISLYKHPTPRLAAVRDESIDGPDGSALKIRIYIPESSGPSGVCVFFHGGGWAVGDLDTHDHVCRYIAGHGKLVIVSVDYRLAPEHPFPAGLDDCVQAIRWTHANAATLNIVPGLIAVGGDSAGGNLAAACCLALKNDTSIKIKHQLLIYPACDFTGNHPSQRDNGEGYLLTSAAMEQFTNWYLPADELRANYLASPQLAPSHADLPPALIITAGYDPLRDEAAHYAKTLEAAGVPTEYVCYEGMVHGFLRMGAKLDVAIEALDDISRRLSNALS
ncbi:MAG: alpha/beta hydrolase [Gammaproteobacteria bacterium]